MLALTVMAVGLTLGGDPVKEADAEFAAVGSRQPAGMPYATAYNLTAAGIKVEAFIPDHPWGAAVYQTYLRDGVPSSRAVSPVAQEVRPRPGFIAAPCPTGT